MPVAFIEMYAAMLPRLQAEDDLRLLRTVNMGFAGGPEADQYARELQRLAFGGEATRLKPPSAADFAAMGISVERG